MDRFAGTVLIAAIIASPFALSYCVSSVQQAREECLQRKGCPPGQRPRYFVAEGNAICTCELKP